MAVEMAASESPATIVEDGFDLAIHSGDLSGLHPGCAKVQEKVAQTTDRSRRHSQYLTRYGAPQIAGRSQPLSIGRFCRAWLRTAVELWLRADAKRVIPTESFEPVISNRCAWASLKHLGIAQAPAWLFYGRTQRRYRHPSSDFL